MTNGPDLHPVIRRAPAWGKKNHPDKALDSWADGLEQLVKDGSIAALTRFNDLTGVDGSTARWKETAAHLVAYRDDPTKPPVGFGPAYYGYAIEAYALARLKTLDSKLPGGFGVAPQVTFGMTRPDVVVYDSSKTDVGWFDITSKRSAGHIHKKTGSQWQTRPYVAEILYDNFDISRLAPGNTTPEEQQRAQSRYREKEAAWNEHVQSCRADYEGVFKQVSGAVGAQKGGGLNAKEWATATRDAFTKYLGKEVEVGVCRDLLRAFGIDPKAYALGTGGSKQKGLSLLRARVARAPDVEEEGEEPGDEPAERPDGAQNADAIEVDGMDYVDGPALSTVS